MEPYVYLFFLEIHYVLFFLEPYGVLLCTLSPGSSRARVVYIKCRLHQSFLSWCAILTEIFETAVLGVSSVSSGYKLLVNILW